MRLSKDLNMASTMLVTVAHITLFISMVFVTHSQAFAGDVPSEKTCIHSETRFSCVTYVRNYDGDTVTVNIPGIHPLLGTNINIRVAGIDTAELRTKDACEKDMANKAKDFVARLLTSATRIDLVDVRRDKYFRILADIEVNGASLAKTLLGEKLAVPYEGGRKQKVDWCAMQDKPKLAH